MTLPAVSIDGLPEEFFIELAVGVNSFLEVCDNYNLTEEQALALEGEPAFQRRLRIATAAVEDDGTAFRARCRTAVVGTVDRVMNMLSDADVPASTQLDAFKTLAKFGGLDPQPVDSRQSGPGLMLNIVAPDGTTMNFASNGDQGGETIEAANVATSTRPTTSERDEPAARLSILPPAASAMFGAS